MSPRSVVALFYVKKTATKFCLKARTLHTVTFNLAIKSTTNQFVQNPHCARDKIFLRSIHHTYIQMQEVSVIRR